MKSSSLSRLLYSKQNRRSKGQIISNLGGKWLQ